MKRTGTAANIKRKNFLYSEFSQANPSRVYSISLSCYNSPLSHSQSKVLKTITDKPTLNCPERKNKDNSIHSLSRNYFAIKRHIGFRFWLYLLMVYTDYRTKIVMDVLLRVN